MNRPSGQLAEIARHREQMRARAAAQRAAIGATFKQWERPLGATDRVLTVVRFVRSHPLLLAAAMAALVALPRGRLVSLVGHGIAGWRLWQSVTEWLAERRNQRP
jgi:hypothetical protein